jgi:hypothetical protein
MNDSTGYAYDDVNASAYDRGTIVAIFASRDDARRAIADVHEAGFKQTWMGVTTTDDARYDTTTPLTDTRAADAGTTGTTEVRTAEGGGFGETLARFFGAEQQRPLYDALTERGVPASDARALEYHLTAGGAVVTVKTHDRYEEVYAILQQDRGELADGDATAATGLGSSSTAYGIADRDRSQVRDAAGVARGEGVDAPATFEEIFVERRSAGDAAGRVPLMRDEVVVDKRPTRTTSLDPRSDGR